MWTGSSDCSSEMRTEATGPKFIASFDMRTLLLGHANTLVDLHSLWSRSTLYESWSWRLTFSRFCHPAQVKIVIKVYLKRNWRLFITTMAKRKVLPKDEHLSKKLQSILKLYKNFQASSRRRRKTCHFRGFGKYSNREITSTRYYVNSRRHVDSEKIRVPDGIWTHDPPWSSRMFYHWATGDSVVSKGQIVGIDWNPIARLQGHVSPRIYIISCCCYFLVSIPLNHLKNSRVKCSCCW